MSAPACLKSGAPSPTVGRPLTLQPQFLVPGLPPPTHLPPLRAVQHGVLNRCPQCSQVAASPCPEPPVCPNRRTEEEALQRRIEGAQTPSHGQAGPAGTALHWIHVHLRDPTSVAHLSHVFVP